MLDADLDECGGGPATGRSNLRPHREFSARAFAIQMNRYFLTEGTQYTRFILPDNRP
jgi:hypothetical protein